jgi:hypothetical protein
MQPQPATFSHLGPAVRLISIPAQAFSFSGDQLPVHGQTLPIPATPFTTACLHMDASGNPQIVEMMNSQKAQEKALTGSSLERSCSHLTPALLAAFLSGFSMDGL